MLEMRRDNRSLESAVRRRTKAIGGEKYLCGEFTALSATDVFSYAWDPNPLWTTLLAPIPAADHGFDLHCAVCSFFR